MSTTPTTTQKVTVPAEHAGKPWRWMRVRNHWNWRSGTNYLTTSPWFFPAISISAEGYSTPYTSTTAPFNGATSYVTAMKPDLFNTAYDASLSPNWSPLHGEYFPKEVTIGITAIPLGNNSNAFATISLLELEFSDSLTTPLYT